MLSRASTLLLTGLIGFALPALAQAPAANSGVVGGAVQVFSTPDAYTPLVFAVLPGGDVVVVGQRELEDDGNPDLKIARLSLSGQRRWEQDFGHDTRATSVARMRVTADGSLVLLHDFLDPDGEHAVALQKLDGSGKALWQYIFKASTPSDIALLNNGEFFAVGSASPRNSARVARLQRFDANGRQLMAKDYAARNRQAADLGSLVEAVPEGGAVVGGVADFEESSPEAGQGGDAWVFRVDAEGALLWQWFAGTSTSAERVAALDRAPDGSIFVALAADSIEQGGTGNRLVKLAADGGEVWDRPLDDDASSLFILDLIADGNGGVVAAGFASAQSSDSFMAVVAAFDSTGKPRWRRDYQNPSFERAVGIRRVGNGYAVLLDAGSNDDRAGSYVGRLSATGEIVPPGR